MKYANIISSGTRLRNYGEDIQLLAIEKLYEYMGIPYDEVVRITATELFTYDGDEYLLLPVNWPFWGSYSKLSDKIIPVYLGISALGDAITESMRFKQFEPIGCRDQRTFEICQRNGIAAYINGCISLTLPKREEAGDKVYIVDACEELLDYIPKDMKENAVYKTHVFYNREIHETESAQIYEEYKKNARLVISSRLHCIIPCIAYGIPVVYAAKYLSTRSNWLKSLIPLYDEKSFDMIDWNPDAVEIEDLKKKILENAAERIRETWNKYEKKCSLTEFFYDRENHTLVAEDLRESITYLDANWAKDGTYKYIIWGITQTAQSLDNYIKKEYPNASCVGIIDMYRKIPFQGMIAQGIEILDDIKDAVVFVAAESIHSVALKTFKEKEINQYVLCWKNHNYKMKEDI